MVDKNTPIPLCYQFEQILLKQTARSVAISLRFNVLHCRTCLSVTTALRIVGVGGIFLRVVEEVP